MKILIISHPSLNTHNNMGKTMLSLFTSFDKEELCQLVIDALAKAPMVSF